MTSTLKWACRLALTTLLYGVQSLAASPIDPAEARRLHERMLVLDTHLDAPANFVKPGWDVSDRHSFGDDGSQVDLPRMIEGGLDGGFWAIYTGQGPRTPQGYATARDTALLRALSIHQIVARYPQSNSRTRNRVGVGARC